MIPSLFQGVRDWFRKIGNGSKEELVENAALAGSDRIEKSASEQTADSETEVPEPLTAPKRRRSSRPRRPRKRVAGKNLPTPTQPNTPQPAGASIAADDWDLANFAVEPAEGQTRFHDLDLPPAIMHAVADLGFHYCTPIQAAILPHTLKGLDATGRAQTGTGKSAAFLITIINHLLHAEPAVELRSRTPRALIMAPTRELVLQIEQDARLLAKYTRINTVAVFGGLEYERQKRLLDESQVDIVVATPGRLLDFKQQRVVDLSKVEILVIDEADRMLDMGFIPDMRRIINSTPPKSSRQTMLFSATLTAEVTRLASQWTSDPLVVEIEPEQVAVDSVDQMVYITTTEEKFVLLYNMIVRQELERVIVFGNRRDETRRLQEQLRAHGISCALISGEVTQKQRIRTLENFRSGKIRVLVATDVAARGLHVEGVSHVVNYNLPVDPESYVHRIGRTGRAGASGISVSFACEEDSFQIPTIEALLGRELHCIHPDEEWLEPPPPPSVTKRPRRPAPSKKPRRRPTRRGRS